MSDNIKAGLARATQELGRAEQAIGLSASLGGLIGQISQGLHMVQASGIAPGRMPSTLALLNELKREHENNHRRILSLAQGISAVIG